MSKELYLWNYIYHICERSFCFFPSGWLHSAWFAPVPSTGKFRYSVGRYSIEILCAWKSTIDTTSTPLLFHLPPSQLCELVFLLCWLWLFVTILQYNFRSYTQIRMSEFILTLSLLFWLTEFTQQDILSYSLQVCCISCLLKYFSVRIICLPPKANQVCFLFLIWSIRIINNTLICIMSSLYHKNASKN